MADYKGVDMREFADEGLMEVSGLISRREYNLSIVKARQLADRIVRAYAAEKDIAYDTFADTIERLYAGGYISMRSRDDYHTIRIYGNKAVQEADDSQEDAESCYYLLKNEIDSYFSRKVVSVDRTPVRVDRPSSQDRSYISADSDKQEAGYLSDYSSEGRSERRRKAAASSGESGQRSPSGGRGTASSRASGGLESMKNITIYDILRVLIPVIVIILIIIIIRSLMPGGSSSDETQPSTAIETSAETDAETETETETEPVTEAQPVRYQIKGNGVNVRYADNKDRIYTQLSDGTVIGEAVESQEYPGFYQFTMDGVELLVSGDFITEAE